MSARTWPERSSLERSVCASILLKALQGLHGVCLGMELEKEGKRPTTAQYQRAMQNAERALATVNGSAA
ncbi:hypothetical protein [Variovorax sp. JS1663]|uniref:hypothetical protein n=1 Tax=Variovorax sp. JS1663 TaxID=1851577 RepID=UPI00117F1713|nr:hypothetical protein [Variovorax sp. JS1663]